VRSNNPSDLKGCRQKQGNPCEITSSVSPESVTNSPRSVMPTSSQRFGPAQSSEHCCTSSVVTSQRPQRSSSTSPPGMPLARKQSRPFLCRTVGRQHPAVVRGCQPRQPPRVQRAVLEVTRGDQSGDPNKSRSPPAMTMVMTIRTLATLTRSSSSPSSMFLSTRRDSLPITLKSFLKQPTQIICTLSSTSSRNAP
jgi:hypothetical protein